MTPSGALARQTDLFAGEDSYSPASRCPDRRAWVNNERTGQLSCFAPGPIVVGVDGGSSDWRAPQQLQINRWCHGELRVSLTPRYSARALRDVKPAPYAGPAQAREYLGYIKPVKRSREKRANTLVRRPEFTDDVYEIPGYGRLAKKSVLSRYAARQLQECSEISERACGKSGVCLTGTLAGSFAVAFYTVACYASNLTKLLRNWVSSKFTERCYVFGTWEPQIRGALHIHLVVQSRDRAGLSTLLVEFHDYWRKLLLDLSAATNVDLFAKNENKTWIDDPRMPRSDAQWLRKSPAKYLGKYMGKEALIEQNASLFCPPRWTTVDWKTAREAAAERIRVVLGGCDVRQFKRLFDDLIDLASPLADNVWCYWSKVFAQDQTYIVELSGDNRADFWDILKAAVRVHCGEIIGG